MSSRQVSIQERRQRGASLLEAAFVTPVFMLLVFGAFEVGFLMRNYLTVTTAASDGARTASVAARADEADYLILRTLEHSLEPIGLDKVDFVVVYQADSASDPVPPICFIQSNAAAQCNRYTPADFFLGLDDAAGQSLGNFRCEPTAVDHFWCPTDRKAALSDPPDYIGVYIQARHNYLTGFIGDTRTITVKQTIRIEPERP